MASHFHVEATKKSEQSKRAASLLEFKLNIFFERQIGTNQREEDNLIFLEKTLERLGNAQVLYYLEQKNIKIFNCTRQIIGNSGRIDHFIITF